jgi:hypothetical protein
MIKHFLTSSKGNTLIIFKTNLVIYFTRYFNNITLYYHYTDKTYSEKEINKMYNRFNKYKDLFETIDISDKQLNNIIKNGTIQNDVIKQKNRHI